MFVGAKAPAASAAGTPATRAATAATTTGAVAITAALMLDRPRSDGPAVRHGGAIATESAHAAEN